MPDGRPTGVNFGISLSLWDWLFGSVIAAGHDFRVVDGDVFSQVRLEFWILLPPTPRLDCPSGISTSLVLVHGNALGLFCNCAFIIRGICLQVKTERG